MSVTNYGIGNYSAIMKSPVAKNLMNPVSNLLLGAVSSKTYADVVAKKLSSTVSAYMSSLNKNTSELKNSAKGLSSKTSESSFDKKSLTSSDNNSVMGSADDGAQNASYKLNISQLATTQTNTGNQLCSNDTTAFSIGTNSISIKVGNIEKTASFTINEADNNHYSLQKMASAINSANFGISANVISDKDNGISYLKIQSKKTGTDSSFSISDRYGNSSEVSGSNYKTGDAKNAYYTMDGKEYSSQSNTVKLSGSDSEITFKKASGNDINVNIQDDKESIKSDITKFVSRYNNMISFIDSSKKDFGGAATIEEELSKTIGAKKYSLQQIGIDTNKDGTLSIDSKKLDKALSENLPVVKKVFSGENAIADKVYDTAREILQTPLKYTKPVELSNYNSKYSMVKNLYAGMLFDSFL